LSGDDVARSGDRARRRDRSLGPLRSRKASEVAVDKRVEIIGHVTRDHERRVPRHVPRAIEREHVADGRGLDVVVAADREVAQRMTLGIQRERNGEPLCTVRHVLVALAALRANDRLLGREPLLVEVRREVAHALALEPQRELELMRGHDLVIRGAIGAGRCVRFGRAGALQHLVVMRAEPLGRALE